MHKLQTPLITQFRLKNVCQSFCILLYTDDVLLFIDNVSLSITHLLIIFNQFSSISDQRINWTKSALLFLNDAMKLASVPPIPVVKHFKYVGIEISPIPVYHG